MALAIRTAESFAERKKLGRVFLREGRDHPLTLSRISSTRDGGVALREELLFLKLDSLPWRVPEDDAEATGVGEDLGELDLPVKESVGLRESSCGRRDSRWQLTSVLRNQSHCARGDPIRFEGLR